MELKNTISNGVKLSIIIVSWNVREKLKQNLTSLLQSAGIYDFEIFVVDNASSDGTIEMVKSEFPSVKLISNSDNLGFARANNQAIPRASGEYILLLNPDMRVFPNTLAKITQWMDENKNASVAGCHLLDEKGETINHVRRFPQITDQMSIVLKIPHLFPRILDGYLRKDFDYGRPARVDSIRGGFFMLRRDTVEKVGLLDERFFLWFEEVDYCRRVISAGMEIWYTPAAKCIDLVGQSFAQLGRGAAQSYFQDSQLKYFKKWQPHWQYFLLLLAWPTGKLLAILGEKLGIKNQVKT